MRLRSQLLLGVCGVALLCGVSGTWLLSEVARARASNILDESLQTGRVSLLRALEYERRERRAIYDGVAAQSYLRAYLLAGDRGQMGYFVGLVRSRGAEAAAIVDRTGEILAADGPGIAEVVAHQTTLGLNESGSIVPAGRRMVTAYKIPIGGSSGAGHLIVLDRVTAALLERVARPLQLEAAIGAGEFLVGTAALEGSDERIRAAFATARGELQGTGGVLRVASAELGRVRLLVGIPLERLRGLTAEMTKLVGGLLFFVLVLIGLGALLFVGRVTRPLERLGRAAAGLVHRRGELAASELASLSARADEIGELARTIADTGTQLGGLAGEASALATGVDEIARKLERAAVGLVDGAARQDQRVQQVRAFHEPTAATGGDGHALARTSALADQLARTPEQLDRLLSTVAVMASRVSATTQTLVRRGRSGSAVSQLALESVLEELTRLGVALEEPRALPRRIAKEAVELRRHLDELRVEEGTQRQRGRLMLRALDEIGRISAGHAEEAGALRTTSSTLRAAVLRLTRSVRTLRGDG